MRRGAGCLAPLLLIGLLALELWLVLEVGELIDEPLGAILLALGTSIAGWYLLRWRLRRLTVAAMAGRGSAAMIGAVGAILVVFPGFATGALGLLLQLPPLQTLVARAAGPLLQRQLRQAAQRMQGAEGRGFPGGGFPGGLGGMDGMGGMGGRPPDDRRAFPRAGEAIDTTAERVEGDEDRPAGDGGEPKRDG